MFDILSTKRKYRALHGNSKNLHDEESEELLTDGDHVAALTARKSKAWIGFTLLNLVLFVASLTLRITTHYQYPPGKNAALKRLSYWSPILDDVEIPSFTAKINGTLFPKEHRSIAREEPSSVNDEAWHKFEKVLTHVVTRDEIIKLGKDPETVARFEDEYWGMGNDAYMVQLDVMHQIHCLNLLRKAAFAEYPGYSPELGPFDKMWWIHLSHCTDILLQNIQCAANTEVLTLAWVESRDVPWPDFSVNRQCRDFDTLVKWQQEHAVDADKFDKMPVPENAFKWPAPWKKQDFELGEKLGQQDSDLGLPESHSHGH
ncbi:hypothetical protein BBO_08288 [Beauveria brongniartii RCEF 3172]|uniref:Tat pathway signal sequence n=1 Tax=Beauveria brongniartii RCEF 3172 TaxID=1081107 RepID=A0A166XS11_9HYPO|nr:hypothetical protein BBO_08288 [Beauveria brongniartii RCEF 3172]